MNATGWMIPLVTTFASPATAATVPAVATTEHGVSATVAEGG